LLSFPPCVRVASEVFRDANACIASYRGQPAGSQTLPLSGIATAGPKAAVRCSTSASRGRGDVARPEPDVAAAGSSSAREPALRTRTASGMSRRPSTPTRSTGSKSSKRRSSERSSTAMWSGASRSPRSSCAQRAGRANGNRKRRSGSPRSRIPSRFALYDRETTTH